MTRRAYLYAMLLLAAAGALAWVVWPKVPAPLRASVVGAAAPADVSGFARAEGPVLSRVEGAMPLAFPADHGPHNDFQTEWWYTTGNLTADTGEHFGYQLTFFRRALTPPDGRAQRTSAWAADQVYMAHFAITDVSGGVHSSFERLTRGAAGLAGAQTAPFRVWLEDWEVAGPSADQMRLRASAQDTATKLNLSLDLNLVDLKGPILQGDRGYSRKGPEAGNASFYISLTRIATEGTVTVRGETFRVTGASWMDHEFSTSALGAEQVGWDWFSIQLDDKTELMLFQLRRADGSVDAFSSGMLIAADGSTRTLGPADFTLQGSGAWRSPRSGAVYPAAWGISIPSAGVQLALTPWLADQEMNVSQKYWEGAVRVEGTSGGRAVRGQGYVEMTGYAGSMQGQF